MNRKARPDSSNYPAFVISYVFRSYKPLKLYKFNNKSRECK